MSEEWVIVAESMATGYLQIIRSGYQTDREAGAARAEIERFGEADHLNLKIVTRENAKAAIRQLEEPQ